jgi:hypothetical protein
MLQGAKSLMGLQMQMLDWSQMKTAVINQLALSIAGK